MLDGRLRDAVQLTSRTPLGLDRSSRVGDADDASDSSGRHERRADQDDLVEGTNGFVVRGEGVSDKRARDEDADERDADQAGDAGDRVVDRGRDPGVGLVGVGEHGGGERGDRHRQTQREEEQGR